LVARPQLTEAPEEVVETTRRVARVPRTGVRR
jgi:hypothetical protein